MNHAQYCRTLEHTDPAKRIHDTYSLHRLADPIGNIGRWFAVAIADGTSDRVLYDSRRDAIRHQHHNEHYYAYIQIVPSDMTLCDCEFFLSGVKKMYDARKALMDRDHHSGGLEPITRLAVEDQMAMVNGRTTNLIIPGRFKN